MTQETHSGRLRQISGILLRHGLGYMLGIVGLERFVPFHWGVLGHARCADPYTQPEHLRLTLEELGTTFIKLGQIHSTRPDIVPSAYLADLAKLQDAAPAIAIADIRAAIEAELGCTPEELFAGFEETPLATGSIGQAHAATLHDGTEVVVKVRRPGVVEQVEGDLALLQNLAVRASRHWEPAGRSDVVGLAQEFAHTLRAEHAATALLDLGMARGPIDRGLLAADLAHMLADCRERPLGEAHVGPIIAEVQAIVRRHQLQLPANLALRLKTIAMSEGLGAQREPTFVLGQTLAPFAQRLLLRQFAPARLARRLGEAGVELRRLAVELPRLLRRLASELDHGGPSIGVRPDAFDPPARRLERLANRVILGILAGAFVLGLAVLMTVHHSPGWSSWADAVCGAGFAVAAVLGSYLAWSIFRSG